MNGTPEAGVNVSARDEDDGEGKIYCANCIHCKLIPEPVPQGSGRYRYYLRVRCDAGMWKKKLGDEKRYKYFTVARRSMDECPSYIPMGDPREFLRELKRNLPIRDEVYG